MYDFAVTTGIVLFSVGAIWAIWQSIKIAGFIINVVFCTDDENDIDDADNDSDVK